MKDGNYFYAFAQPVDSDVGGSADDKLTGRRVPADPAQLRVVRQRRDGLHDA